MTERIYDMHPKAYELLVNHEQHKRAKISLELARLALEFEESLATELAIELPDGIQNGAL